MSSSPPNITSAGTRQFTVVAYKTEAEARAWCVSQQELFDRVEVWLADNLLHPYTFDREPFAGVCEVTINDDQEAVLFQLRWDEHLADKDDPPWKI